MQSLSTTSIERLGAQLVAVDIPMSDWSYEKTVHSFHNLDSRTAVFQLCFGEV